MTTINNWHCQVNCRCTTVHQASISASRLYKGAAILLSIICIWNNIYVITSTIKKNIDIYAGKHSHYSRSGGTAVNCGICLMQSTGLPVGLCPLWCCLGALVCFLGPFWSLLQLLGLSIFSNLTGLLPHLSDWYLCITCCFLCPDSLTFMCTVAMLALFD